MHASNTIDISQFGHTRLQILRNLGVRRAEPTVVLTVVKLDIEARIAFGIDLIPVGVHLAQVLFATVESPDPGMQFDPVALCIRNRPFQYLECFTVGQIGLVGPDLRIAAVNLQQDGIDTHLLRLAEVVIPILVAHIERAGQPCPNLGFRSRLRSAASSRKNSHTGRCT